ncbi:uncharacterized protein LOC125829343 [Solanum verrucosum]|uniref:uncharacterized protein LOC125829343 n=1 Tax=Solanum verrucosum TaxID=315347 RepID=UPI0020CFFEFB|nr:uncharacterized protein LOC125829343 [Solanum verrucosum]
MFTAFIRGVPNDRIDDESLKEYFYRGQDDNSKIVLDTITGGSYASKNDDVIEVNGESENATEKEAEITQKVVPMPRPPSPFPQRLVKKTEEGKYRKFISMLKQISINVPLIEALEKMPGYAKFMKDLVTKKRVVSFEDDDELQHCSAIATRSLLQKKEDREAFTIPCTTGLLHFPKALGDLGASINLMPLAIYKNLGLGDPKPTVM